MNTHGIVTVFHFISLLIAIGSIVYFFIDYQRDKNMALVDYKTFHETERDIYPSFSICFYQEGFWNTNKLKGAYDIENLEDYRNFLKGQFWNEKMINVNYDDVTLSLEDYVQSWKVWMDSGLKPFPDYAWSDKDISLNHSGILSKKNLSFSNGMFQFFISLRSNDGKCFSLNLPPKNIPRAKDKTIRRLEVSFKNLNSIDSMLAYVLHYPGQLIAGNFYFDIESTQSKNFTARTRYFIDAIEVIRRRNTQNQPCREEFEEHDEYILKKLVQSIKCKPSYFAYDYKFGYTNTCNDTESMKKAYIRGEDIDSPAFRKQFDKPCDQIQMVTHSRKDFPGQPWTLEFTFSRDVYKEIRHISSYDLKSFGADVSAVIGFICGFSVWQLPSALKMMVSSIKKSFFL